jgi:hypothetical protein
VTVDPQIVRGSLSVSDLVVRIVTAFTILECACEYLLLAAPGSNPAYFPVIMNVRGLVVQIAAVLLAVVVAALRKVSNNRIPKSIGIFSVGVVAAALYFAYFTGVLYDVPTPLVVVGTVVTFLVTCALLLIRLPVSPRMRSVTIAANLFATLVVPWIVATLLAAR